MFLLGLAIGIVLGTIFNVVFKKWFGKAKAVGSEVANDFKTEYNKIK